MLHTCFEKKLSTALWFFFCFCFCFNFKIQRFLNGNHLHYFINTKIAIFLENAAVILKIKHYFDYAIVDYAING